MAISTATTAPIDTPHTSTLSRPTLSRMATMSSACLLIDDEPVTPWLSPRPRRSGMIRLRSGRTLRSQFHWRRWLMSPWMTSTGAVIPLASSTTRLPPGTGTSMTPSWKGTAVWRMGVPVVLSCSSDGEAFLSSRKSRSRSSRFWASIAIHSRVDIAMARSMRWALLIPEMSIVISNRFLTFSPRSSSRNATSKFSTTKSTDPVVQGEPERLAKDGLFRGLALRA